MITAVACARPGRTPQGFSAPLPLSSARDVAIKRSPVRRRVIGLLQALQAEGRSSEQDVSAQGMRFRTAITWCGDAGGFDLSGHLERTLKATAYALDAGLIGGGNVTRLERMIQVHHPRLSYRDALSLLARRGFGLRFGDDLNPAAAACLTYQCGNLPVQVIDCPGGAIAYLMPFAGEVARGSLRATTPSSPAESVTRLLDVQIDIERLVDYFLAAGRASVGTD